MAIMTPCGEKGHSPVLLEPGMPGKGYFLIPGTKLSSGRRELIKSDPDVALRSEKGCGYAKCDSTWWSSVEAYTDEYPKEVRCEQRETLISVQWADPDSDGCREHPDSPVWAQQGAEMVATGVHPEGPQSDKVGRKPKGRAAHRVTMSKDGKRKMSLRIGSGNPVSEVRRRQGKDKSGKTTTKIRPAKGKTVDDQFADPSESTGSQGEPGSETEVNPAESMVDPMDMEVEEEVSRAFRNIPYQKK